MTSPKSHVPSPTSVFGRFFLPGPTEVHPEVAAAMLRPMMSHRGAEFRALFARLQDGLRPFLATTQPVVIVPASATSMMEMAVRSAPPGRILALANGAFSERFADVAQACGRDVESLEVPWGAAHDLDDVARELARTRYAAVTVAHCETSTGVFTDVRALAGLAHANGAVALIDSVTGAGGAPCDTDAWQLDFLFTGSQKALALPPGLAIAVAQPSLVASARTNEGRGRYLDLAEYVDSAGRNETPSTPALSLLYALDAQLERIAAEGMNARIARHAAMAAATHAWVSRHAELGVSVLAPVANRAPTVTVIRLPEGVTGPKVLAAMYDRGYTLGSGYGELGKTCVRIGHMGDHTVAGVESCLDALEESLTELR